MRLLGRYRALIGGMALCLLFSPEHSHALAPLKNNFGFNAQNVKSLKLSNSFKVNLINLKEFRKRGFNSLKERIVKENQKINGIKVYGSKIINHYYGQAHLGRFEKKISETNLIQIPFVTATHAREVAKSNHEISNSKVELVVYPIEGSAILVWKVEEVAFDSRKIVFVNALTGEEVDSFNALTSIGAELAGVDSQGVNRDFIGKETENGFELFHEEYNVKTHKHKAGKVLPGEIVTSSNSFFDFSPAVDVHFYTSEIIRLLKDKFDRSGFDDDFGATNSTVHYVRSRDFYINAFWNGRQLVYGKGDNKTASDLSGALDVIAHEFSHALTEKTSKLIYRNESGALNEAFSDIMGTYFEYLIQPDQFDWKLGEDVWTPNEEGDALRYMNDPAKDKSSRDHYSTRYTGFGDNGGVHINSGIANLAFYLLSEGGSHPRRSDDISVNGVGIEKAIQIFYKAFTEFLSPSAKFQDARDATVYVALLESVDLAKEVHKAWLAVGVNGNEPKDENDEPDNPSDPNDPEQPKPVKVVETNSTVQAIPDRNSDGISSIIEVKDNVKKLKIHVEIEHTYIGDLYVRVESPYGQTYTIHRRVGGGRDNISKTVEINLPSSALSKGDWELKISDHAFFDTGSLNSWSIEYML